MPPPPPPPPLLLLLLLAPATSAAVAAAAAGGAAAAGPNFIILLADDYGYGDPSPPLGVGVGQTPELNAMALAPGAAHFPRSYIGGSVCSPSRASILSGRSCSRDCVISVESMALPLQLQGNTLADVARASGRATFFAGKCEWLPPLTFVLTLPAGPGPDLPPPIHQIPFPFLRRAGHLGSLSVDPSVGCYNASLTNSSCLPGYIAPAATPDLCCDGRDGQLPLRTPRDFGFQNVMATPQVAPSATSNCGCVQTVAGAGEGCELGHYAGDGHYPAWLPALECMQSYETDAAGVWGPKADVADVDDAQMLVNRLERFLETAVQNDTPFLAQVSFHQTHIPYVSPPEFRVPYSNYSLNEQDYFGSAQAMDAQVGRVRRILRDLGLDENTMVVFSADNGPEVDPAGGQGTNGFANPGVTGGLSGRKRAMLEGGIRVTGIVEAPWLVRQANGGAGGPLRLPGFAQSHVDILPTVLDLLNATRRNASWPLDGISLVPALTASAPATLQRAGPLGWLCAWPLTVGDAGAACPNSTQVPPSFPASGFALPAGQQQSAWMERELKLVGCLNPAKLWNFRLFDVDADAAEANDLFAAREAEADAMFVRMQAWLASVDESRANESQCAKQQ
jgi:arylsulfatase A-like enzyme